jgi:hypothetical protein
MMSSIRRIRRPVKREDAEQYLMVTLLGFAASVILIRLFLDLTGYPDADGFIRIVLGNSASRGDKKGAGTLAPRPLERAPEL